MQWLPRLFLCVLFVAGFSVAQAADLTNEQRALHVLNRLGYGPKPGDIRRVLDMGVEHYIDMQLHPEAVPLSAAYTQRLQSMSSQTLPAGELLSELNAARTAVKQDGDEGKQQRRELVRRITEQTAQARLVQAIDSPRQLEEVMVDFWFNHFNVFADKGLDRALVGSYERDAIRPYVLGRFRDLLGATAHHPAMLFYLDNWLSVAPGYQPAAGRKNGAVAKAGGLNENYARELMELHTLGVDGGYTQQDVTELARMLTGWTFNPRLMMRGEAGFHFDMRRHDQGDKEWLGHHIAAGGQEEGERALDVLAAHPATARHISYELAQYFVADQPSPALVDRLTHRFLDSGGDIRAVLRTLFDSPEFWASANVGTKFKTPYQYVVSSLRAADVDLVNVRPVLGALSQLGMPLYGCQTPDGYKNTEQAWLNPDALARRINIATMLASGRVPLDRAPVAEDGGQMRGQRVRMERSEDHHGTPSSTDQLLATLGSAISDRTRAAVAAGQPALRAALVLGSPDFMRH